MNQTTDASQKEHNYDYITYDFDLANAKPDEASVYYIKLLMGGVNTFLSGIINDNLDVDSVPIDYEHVDFKKQFKGKTLFSTAIGGDYLNQTDGVLKYLEGVYGATRQDPDNLKNRDFLRAALKTDDNEVVKKIAELMPYEHKGVYEDLLNGPDFATVQQNADIIRRITALLPSDFKQSGSWFGEFIKTGQFYLAEKYLKPYENQYTDANILIADLSLDDIQVSKVLKETASKNPKSVYGRIHGILKKILPTDLYLGYILNKERYDLNFEDRHSEGSIDLKKVRNNAENQSAKGGNATAVGNPGNAVKIKNNFSDSDPLALFTWAQRQRGRK